MIFKNNIYLSHRNRGMTLESDINETNKYYLLNNIAVIYKKPTPIKVVKVDYKIVPAKILEGYFNTPSTTDYNGIYKGKYIDFEAKETKLDYFPLKNIHPHQIKHLLTCKEMGGIIFVIIKFLKYDKVFLIDISSLVKFKDKIPYTYFKDNVSEIKYKYNPRLDYLDIIDKMEDLWKRKKR